MADILYEITKINPEASDALNDLFVAGAVPGSFIDLAAVRSPYKQGSHSDGESLIYPQGVMDPIKIAGALAVYHGQISQRFPDNVDSIYQHLLPAGQESEDCFLSEFESTARLFTGYSDINEIDPISGDILLPIVKDALNTRGQMLIAAFLLPFGKYSPNQLFVSETYQSAIEELAHEQVKDAQVLKGVVGASAIKLLGRSLAFEKLDPLGDEEREGGVNPSMLFRRPRPLPSLRATSRRSKPQIRANIRRRRRGTDHS
jgi:hypothetical protein